ncbi:MAG TPA: hypothetical protein VK168_20335 [Saprospiraceae bacterium]|nr:hypothetical protein [Saprospiraceae bacterium]
MIAHIDLWGMQQLKPKMERINDPSEIFSTKMLVNAWEGAKTMARELVTEPVGKLLSNTGEVVGKAGVIATPIAPPVGGAMTAIGGGMEFTGSLIIVADQNMNNNLTFEAKGNLIIDATFTFLPAPMEATVGNSVVKQEVKDYTLFQLRAMTEIFKDKTKQDFQNSQQQNNQ